MRLKGSEDGCRQTLRMGGVVVAVYGLDEPILPPFDDLPLRCVDATQVNEQVIAFWKVEKSLLKAIFKVAKILFSSVTGKKQTYEDIRDGYSED